MSLNRAQQEAVETLAGPLLVLAGELISLISSWKSYGFTTETAPPPVNSKQHLALLAYQKYQRLLTESLTDYTRRNLLNRYATLTDFLAAWNATDRKNAVLEELQSQGIFIEELQEQIGQEFDPFDLLCHVAFDTPPLTRRERANNVQKQHYFAKYGEQAAKVLDALLEKYADAGLVSIENFDILKVSPLREFGSPMHIVANIFGGKANFDSAMRELTQHLYGT